MFNEDEETITPETIEELADVEARDAARMANRPMIDHLPDAIERDEFGRLVLRAQPGEKIIIERWASCLKTRPWLDTKTYTILTIDEATGVVRLWDDDLQRTAMSDYVKGTKVGYRFKLPTRKGMNIGKKRRGRPKKNPTDAPVEKVESAPKKRGRPAGAKSRSKEVIAAEKKAKVEARKSKGKKK